MIRSTLIIGAIAGAVALGIAFSTKTETVSVRHVVDGDTFELSTGEKVRIQNVDTPELHPCRCAAECDLAAKARAFTVTALAGGSVNIERGRQDRYGRTVATVTVDGRDLGMMLIDAKLGRAYMGGVRQTWCE